MQLQLRLNYGGVVPFQLPIHASLAPIPVTCSMLGDDVSAQTTFLGDGCMRVRVPRALLGKEGKIDGNCDEMMEFAGTWRLPRRDGESWGRSAFE